MSPSTSPPSSSSASLESRLAALEAQVLGGRSSSSSIIQDVSSRLDQLQTTVEGHTTVSFRETWQESFQLLKELDPDVALTHQQQPLLYKRQQVLAASQSLETDMKQLDVLLKLLLLGTTDSSSSSSSLRLDQVTQAPVLTSGSYKISPRDQERLDALRSQYQTLARRIQSLQTHFQTLLESYHTIMTAASEKCILAQERAN